MDGSNRREFLKSSAALAASMAVLRNAYASNSRAAAVATATPLSQFDYQDVQLLDGPMLVQFQQNHKLGQHAQTVPPALWASCSR